MVVQDFMTAAAAAQRARVGTCLVAASMSAVLGYFGVGSGYLLFAWAVALLLLCFLSYKVPARVGLELQEELIRYGRSSVPLRDSFLFGSRQDQPWEESLAISIGANLLPVILSVQVVYVWLVHMWQKISMAGTLDSPAGVVVSDYAAGDATPGSFLIFALGS